MVFLIIKCCLSIHRHPVPTSLYALPCVLCPCFLSCFPCVLVVELYVPTVDLPYVQGWRTVYTWKWTDECDRETILASWLSTWMSAVCERCWLGVNEDILHLSIGSYQPPLSSTASDRNGRRRSFENYAIIIGKSVHTLPPRGIIQRRHGKG